MLNSALKHGSQEINDEIEVPKQYVEFIKKFCTSHSERRDLYLTLAQLSRYLILSGTNDYRDNYLELNSWQLSEALNKVKALYDPEIESMFPKTAASIMGRMLQLQQPPNTFGRVLLGRGVLLFLKLPYQIKSDYNFDSKLKEYYGFNCFQFIASGLAFFIKSNGVLMKDLTVDIPGLTEIVTPQILDCYIKESTGTPQEYRQLVRGENSKTPHKPLDIYGLDPFFKMPAIHVKRSRFIATDSYLIPQSNYFLSRACQGIFYLLATKEQDLAHSLGKEGQNHFRHAFGSIYREYVAMHLKTANSKAVFVDLDDDFIGFGSKPDFAIIENGICVLFEVKTSLLRVEAKTLFLPEQLRKELSDGSIKKAIQKQLAGFEKLILEGGLDDQRFNNITKVAKIIVGYEDIYAANLVMLPILDDLYPDQCSNLQIATISDIESIGQTLTVDGSLCEKIYKKLQNNRLWAIETFLGQEISLNNDILQNAFDEFMEGLIKDDPEYQKHKNNNI